MKTLFIVCQHGAEKTPFRVIKKYFQGKINYLLANNEAFVKNKRFIESDLNRSFPGKVSGTKEEMIAHDLMNRFSSYDQIIDLHTSTVDSPIFIITTSLFPKHLKLINRLNIKRVVCMEKSIAGGNSLIDYVSLGLSIEVGKEGSRNAKNLYKKFIYSFIKNDKNSVKKEYFSVFGILEKKHKSEKLVNSVKSFQYLKKGDLISKIGSEKRYSEANFYPIMPGEKSYKGVLTLMARKLKQSEIKQFSMII
jgi:succinylglutamate desuccinylase